MKKILYLLTIVALFSISTACNRDDKPITLSVDKTEIIANNEDVATFTVLCEGKDVTDESHLFIEGQDEELGSNIFSTAEAGNYTFYAKRKSHTSEKIEVLAKAIEPENPEEPEEPEEPENPEEPNEPELPEGPIELSASTDTIVANGIDAVNFTVMQDSINITDKTDIFVNDNKIEGNIFTTTQSGNYVVYAKKNDTIISNEITFFAKEYVAPEIPIVITVSTDTIVADGIDEIIFNVTEGKSVITDDIDIYVNGNKIEGNKFTTTTAGNYTAYAKKDNVTSNEISFVAIEYIEPEKPIELTASTTTIIADGVETVEFTVKQDNIDVTNETEIYINDNKIEGYKFTTTNHGTYKAFAKKGDLISNEIEIIAEEYIEPEKPIELTASKNNIIANGTDKTEFTVTQDNVNVTSQSEIYVNGNKINGNSFTTTTPGSYNVYAKKNDVISNEITITAEASADGKTIVFADGVTLTSGWYDVNKIGNGQQNGDINMCWAASCANIIQWWQDRYVEAGNTLPAGAVTGPGTTYQLALMEMYHELWDNSRGGTTSHGITWYFEGRNIMKEAAAGSHAQPLSNNTGGYYSNIWESQILPHVYHDYDYVVVPGIVEYNDLISTEYNNYYLWGNGSGLSDEQRLRKFTELVVEFMDRGVVSLAVSLGSNLGTLHHATTLWGYEIDNATGLLTRIWITDSDDMTTEPKEPVLHEYAVSVHETHHTIKFSGAPYGACYAVALYPVSGYGSR
ncbi:MAG: hypothetical protein J6R32_07235 [Bacteroidales bacterium]|nr:hypothetical protein [Bacteroidales bacterium]